MLPVGAQKALASPSDPLSTSPVCSLESPSLALGPLHPHSLGLRTLLPWPQHLPASRCLSTTAALLLPALCSVILQNTNRSSQTQTRLSTVPRFERRTWTGVSPASTAMPGTLQVLINICQVNEHAKNTRLSSRRAEAHLLLTPGLNHKRSSFWDHGVNPALGGAVNMCRKLEVALLPSGAHPVCCLPPCPEGAQGPPQQALTSLPPCLASLQSRPVGHQSCRCRPQTSLYPWPPTSGPSRDLAPGVDKTGRSWPGEPAPSWQKPEPCSPRGSRKALTGDNPQLPRVS